MEELVKALEQHRGLLLSLYQAVRRMEALQGITDPPEEWEITKERIIKEMEQTGESYEQVTQRLIMTFGGLTDESTENSGEGV